MQARLNPGERIRSGWGIFPGASRRRLAYRRVLVKSTSFASVRAVRSRTSMAIVILAAGVAMAAASAVYWLAMRSWYLEWGATDAEVDGPMRGDREVPRPTSQTT